jgi:Host cell surface-exposed lipoprotein
VKLVIKIALGIILAVIVMTAGCSALLASAPEVRKATAALEDVSAEPQKKSEPAAPAKSAETAGQDNARRSAESYLYTMAFSRKGLIEQLSSEYGAGFSKADAIYAVNHIDVDWNEQAAKSAKNYLDTMAFSRQGLIEQLESEYGAGFTHAQAVYGVNAAGL